MFKIGEKVVFVDSGYAPPDNFRKLDHQYSENLLEEIIKLTPFQEAIQIEIMLQIGIYKLERI